MPRIIVRRVHGTTRSGFEGSREIPVNTQIGTQVEIETTSYVDAIVRSQTIAINQASRIYNLPVTAGDVVDLTRVE